MKCTFFHSFGAWLQFPALLILLSVALLSQTQCTKNPSTDESLSQNPVSDRNEDEGESVVEYYLDGQSVESIEVKEEEDNWIVGLSTAIEGTNNGLLQVYQFTEKADYLEFGSDHGLNLGLQLSIGEHLHHVADSSGVIAYYESTGKIPEWYTQYEAEYIANQQFTGSASDRALFFLYRECYGGGAWAGLTSYVVMPPTWNNTVSALDAVAFGALFSIYNNAFYRNHLMTWANLGFSRQRLCGTPFDNLTSSCIIL